ncbi:MAG: hypothetical protein P4L55_23265 [Syntrophobacteraceae bacterium]|nr:hypothetical protein [Syntrophobacteraceae bacterium]
MTRVIENLVDRLSGPMKFRLIIQPLMAAVFAVRDGLKDARGERPPFFWAIFTRPGHRSDMLRAALKSVGKIFVIAVIIDLVEQFIDSRWFYPGEAFLVAFILACIPYLLIRGPVNRIAQGKQPSPAGDKRS